MGIKGKPRKYDKNNPYVQAITKVKRGKYLINNFYSTSNFTPPHLFPLHLSSWFKYHNWYSPQRDARATLNLKVFTYLGEIYNMNRKKCIIHTDSI